MNRAPLASLIDQHRAFGNFRLKGLHKISLSCCQAVFTLLQLSLELCNPLLGCREFCRKPILFTL